MVAHVGGIGMTPRAKIRDVRSIRHAAKSLGRSHRVHILKRRIAAMTVLTAQTSLEMNVIPEEMGRAGIILDLAVTGKTVIGGRRRLRGR